MHEAAGIPLPDNAEPAQTGLVPAGSALTRRGTQPTAMPVPACHAAFMVESATAPAVHPREQQLALQLMCLALLYWLICVAWGACVHHSTFSLPHHCPAPSYDRSVPKLLIDCRLMELLAEL